jgi:PAS domain S-box-containing protein
MPTSAQNRLANSLGSQLFEHAADPIFILDIEGDFVAVNQAACDHAGYSRAELLKMGPKDIDGPVDSKLISERLAQIRRDRKATFEGVHIHRSGKHIPVEMHISLLEHEGKIYTLNICRDISRRKAAESELNQFKYTLDQTLDCVFMFREDNFQFIYVNEGAINQVGYSEAELLQMTPLDIKPKFTAERFEKLVEPLRNGAQPSITFETVHRHKDGHDIPVEIFLQLVRCANFTPRFMAIVRDITERKAIEKKLLDTLNALEEKELAKTRFLAAAGHDLRQPVTAASLFVEALKLSSPTPSQATLIAKLDESMSTFADLLERLLDISKFDAGVIKPRIESFNLAETFNWLELTFLQAALDKKLRLRLVYPWSQTLIVRADKDLLKSIMMNLVSNAIKFTAQGGVLISARIHSGKVMVQVWDTGIGIAEAHLPKIFDEFYQAANQQRNREAGLGLGLSICKRALSLLDSEIDCRSRLGRGSVFTFNLPLDSGHPGVKAVSDNHAPTENQQFARNTRIVVVEDDELVTAGLVTLLQTWGAEVRQFSNAENALKQHDLGNTDFFVVDYALGGDLNGISLLKALQQRQTTPIRAVVITGDTSSQFMQSIADSPWPVVHKPVNFLKLAQYLRPLKN